MKTMRLLPVGLIGLACCSANQTPAPEHAPYDGGADNALPCTPNLDGKIDANELVPAIGVQATYLISPSDKTRTVDVAGSTNSSGKLEWHFAVDFADDQSLRVAAQHIDGKWYQGSFAAVTDAVVVPIDAAGTTEGVYTHDDHGFYLHGVASASPDGNKTLLPYESPVTLYKFPLEPGAAWTSIGVVKNGTFKGLPYTGQDTYDVKVDGAGQLDLPDYVLTQALRVRTLVTVAPAAGTTTTQRQVSFLFECLGEATRVTSQLGEQQEDFTTALELRRLGLGK